MFVRSEENINDSQDRINSIYVYKKKNKISYAVEFFLYFEDRYKSPFRCHLQTDLHSQ